MSMVIYFLYLMFEVYDWSPNNLGSVNMFNKPSKNNMKTVVFCSPAIALNTALIFLTRSWNLNLHFLEKFKYLAWCEVSPQRLNCRFMFYQLVACALLACRHVGTRLCIMLITSCCCLSAYMHDGAIFGVA